LSPAIVGLDVFAPGFRNAYGCTYTTKGQLYCTDNGPNALYGEESLSATTVGPDPNIKDKVCLVEAGNYYGHPNRNRGLNDTRQNTYYPEGTPSIAGVYTSCFSIGLTAFGGIIEYRGTTFGNALRDNLFFQRWRYTTFMFDIPTQTKVNVGSVVLSALDIVYSPGGAIVGIRYMDDPTVGTMGISAAVPVDSSVTATSAPKLIDVFPYRVASGLAYPITISGSNLTTVKTVSIGTLNLVVVSQTTGRIQCTIPVNTEVVNGQLLDIKVTFMDGTEALLPAAFKWVQVV